MARAHRHYLARQIWHLTHRCHQRQFLLKFARDRQVWVGWLFEARKRFCLCVLDYRVTSNHIHLLVYDREGGDVFPNAMQWVAGRSGQAYNQRKRQKGAYWEDRYHATAVETGEHLRQCLGYIDLNRVRAGVVTRPEQWPDCGYVEVQYPKARRRIIDEERLMGLDGSQQSDGATPALPEAGGSGTRTKADGAAEPLNGEHCGRQSGVYRSAAETASNQSQRSGRNFGGRRMSVERS